MKGKKERKPIKVAEIKVLYGTRRMGEDKLINQFGKKGVKRRNNR